MDRKYVVRWPGAQMWGVFLLSIATQLMADDQLILPPSEETIASPDGEYVLTITMLGQPEQWMSRGSEGLLARLTDNGSEVLWHQPLPQNYRPRFARVSNEGVVVLLDQWINVVGPMAIVVLDGKGETMVEHGFYDIVEVTGVPGAEIVRQAKHGPWMTSIPEISAAGNSVNVFVGDKQLAIALDDGGLRLL